MKLDAKQMSLASLISSSRYGFSVPDFQRNYSWTGQQLEQFWADVTSLAEDKFPDHFLGPIVLLNSENRKPIIDGQQRITTLVVLAGLIRDKFVEDFGDPQYEVLGTTQVYSNRINDLLFLNDLQTPFFQSNYQIKSILEAYVIRSPKSDLRKRFGVKNDKLSSHDKRAAKNLINAQSVLSEKLDTWLDDYSTVRENQVTRLSELVNAMKEGIQFLTIEVENEEDAFTIFETLNERGLKLSPADLIKSYILRKVLEENSKANRDDIIDIWDEIMESLGDYDLTSFLRHYLLTIHNESIQKKVIFKKIKNEIEPLEKSVKPVSPRKKLDDLRTAALSYAQLLANDSVTVENKQIEVSLKKLEMISDNHRIFLLKVFLSNFENDDDLLFAIRSVEKLVFRWIICGENAQVLENHLQIASHKVKNKDRESLQQACQYLISASPSDETFRQALLTRSFRDAKLQAYALRMLNLAITGSEVITERREVSVEHIAPQKPADEVWYLKVAKKELEPEDTEDTATYENYVNKWGNLTILERKLNSTVQNNLWDLKKEGVGKKKPGYRNSNVATTSELLVVQDWTREVIDSRTAWFADCALVIWSKSLPSAKLPQVQGYKFTN
jgi:uncharacterized protein with ParB-like and HNH nuclease domain